MRVVVRVLEAIAVLVPDFQTLGLLVPVFFSLYCCAGMFGLPQAGNTRSALLASLALGYVLAVALNIANAWALPARPQFVSLSLSERSIEKSFQKSSMHAGTKPPTREGVVARQEMDLFEEVQG
jgi:hypothetical protein